jgi:two-component system, OmpR family, sensor histidine kinase CpxA
MVRKTVNARVRSSAQRGGSGVARRTPPKFNRPCRSCLLPSADAHDEVSEVNARARAPERGRPSERNKQREAEYLSREFNELAEPPKNHHRVQPQCLGDISHELKAPVSRIRVLLERARRNPQDICKYLARIEENVLRMEALTGRLLNFSRLELIEESVVSEPCDLTGLVSQVVVDAGIEAEERGCTIKHMLVPRCFVSGNYELLHRAIENVVRNSVKYTRENSSVSVVLSRPSNRLAQILVDDEGPGICEEELGEIFRPFYRAADARANGTLGAGLGLSLSERALKLHGGSIKARNRADGKGLQVSIQIALLNKSQTSAFPI